MNFEAISKKISKAMKADHLKKVDKYYSLIDGGLTSHIVSIRFGISPDKLQELMNDAAHFYNTRIVLIEKRPIELNITYR